MKESALRAAVVLVALAAAAPAGPAQETGPLYATPQECPTFRSPEFISVPIERAYPGVEYNIRPCVRGGTWPYRFELTKSPPGMKIDPAKGTVTWTPAAEGRSEARPHPVEIRATDSAGLTATQAFSVTVGTGGFYFVSPSGDDAGPGTLERPWKTVMRAALGEGVARPATAVLYLRGGEYAVSVPPKPGRKDANVLAITPASPRRWIAWPGEKPVIDLGWSRQRWQQVLDEQKAAGEKEPRSNAYGHRILLAAGTDGAYFDGLEIRNACYYMFVMWNGQKNLTWRRCDLHHLYADYRENPAFIFTFAVDRPGDFKAWGVRPKAKCYERFVIQENRFRDRPYWSPRGWHGGGFIFYTVRDSVVEDNVFERIERGVAFMDKDNGWANTYRNNVIRGDFMAAAQWCNDEIDFHHNYVEGNLTIGHQPGWVKNIWVHHNSIRGDVSLIGGASRVPEPLGDDAGGFAGPQAAESQKAVRDFPAERRTVHFYRNVVDAPGGEGRGKDVIVKLSAKKAFAEKWRYVRWDENLVDSAARIEILWGRYADFSLMKACGFDAKGLQAPVELDAEGNLSAGSPYIGRYGRQRAPAAGTAARDRER